RDSAFLRAARWESRRVLLPRMAVRCMQRAVRGDPIAFQPGQAESRAHFCGTFSLRRTRRLRLGFYERTRDANAGKDSGGAGAYRIQRQIQDHASFLRAAFAYRPRDYRTDGPGARSVCAPIVVLAKARKHPRKSQTVRADSQRFPDEPALTEHEQRAVPIAEENHRRAGDDDN